MNSLALGFLSLNSNGDTVDTVFWGLWLFPFGILVIIKGAKVPQSQVRASDVS